MKHIPLFPVGSLDSPQPPAQLYTQKSAGLTDLRVWTERLRSSTHGDRLPSNTTLAGTFTFLPSCQCQHYPGLALRLYAEDILEQEGEWGLLVGNGVDLGWVGDSLFFFGCQDFT